MASKFENVQNELGILGCQVCYGSGEVDDAEPGDTSFNTYVCKACKGTGFNNSQVYELNEIH